MLCYTFPEPQYLVFTDNAPSLLYYSHLPAMFVALLVGVYILTRNRKSLLHRLLFWITISFSLWTLADLFVWTNVNSDLIMFLWSLFGLLSVGISLLSVYFTYVFLEGRDVSFRYKAIFFILLLPAILLMSTGANISGFNLEACDASGFEHIGYLAYYTGVGVLSMVWIAVLFIRKFFRAGDLFRKEIVFMGIGIEFFLLLFFTTSFLASYLNDLSILSDYSLEQYGLLGMVIFMAFIGVMIVRFKIFNAGIFAAQALLLSLVVLIGAQFTFIASTTYRVVIGLTLALTGVIGIMLIRSVRHEIRQRERLQLLTKQLEDSNEKLKSLDKLKTEFLSLASHQLRSPLTAIKGYASMLDEGSLGKLTEEQDMAAKRIYASAQGLVNLVEDLLNVSKIEQGGMKYEMMPVELSRIVNDLAGEMKIPAQNKGLELRVVIPEDDTFSINADPVKIKQVFLNLVDNSIKYTTSGFVALELKRDKKKIVFTVKDSGVGVTPETKAKLFQKFSRGGEGSKMNTGGSGLGLYLAQEIARAHKGDVTVDSEGLGKGTTFTVILPAA
jgi:signal transduction histidine kinase